MPSISETEVTLPKAYRHKKRKEWGLALIAWEQDGKRGYYFEECGMRILAEGFYGLMREVEAPEEDVARLYARLEPILERDKRSHRSADKAETAAELSFEDQVGLLLADYPEGFGGSKWQNKHRGQTAGKRLKRHRDAAIAMAQKKLAKQALRAYLDEADFVAVWRDVLDVLQATDLVAKAKLNALKLREGSEVRGLAQATFNLLYKDQAVEERFGTFIAECRRTLSKAVPWELPTALLALVDPAQFVCVSPTSFRQQAKWVLPSLSLSNQPSGKAYLGILELARAVSDRLAAAGQKPKDLFDVYDFIRATTSPSAKKRASALAKAKSSSTPSEKAAA